jgi:predicted HTH domain antitoxin
LIVASIRLDLPDSVLLAAGQSPEEFAREAKFLLALKLFEIGRISSGRAAALCELPRVEFLFRAGRMNVPVADLDDQELEREFMDD